MGGVVSQADMFRVAQLRPGDSIRFEVEDPEDAVRRLKSQYERAVRGVLSNIYIYITHSSQMLRSTHTGTDRTTCCDGYRCESTLTGCESNGLTSWRCCGCVVMERSFLGLRGG